jgi:hypothetical protein
MMFRMKGVYAMQNDAVEALVAFMQGYESERWAQMPDLELYMDQVITYLKRRLEPFQDSPEENLITPSIINNYVKAGFVPRPERKKYARRHLAALMMACMLKRVLPIGTVKRLIEQDGSPLGPERYDRFLSLQKEAFAEEAALLKQLTDGAAGDRPSLYELATHFALRAAADRLIADRIMAAIDLQQPPARAGRVDGRAEK